MFNPTTNCEILITSGKTDVYGQALPGKKVPEKCTVVFLNIHSSKVQTSGTSTPSEGNADEATIDAKILLSKKTIAEIDDVIRVRGSLVTITSKSEKYDVNDNLDHFEVTAQIWK